MALNDFTFTSESVSEGHPDKICDQISDAVLDAFLKKDPRSRVACETLVTTDFVCIAGEVASTANVNVESIARDVIRKICDQISDAVLDAFLKKDPRSRVACETLVTTDFVCIAGEVASTANVNVESIARDVIRKIGYVHKDIGFDADQAEVLVKLHAQSPDIAQGVTGEGLYKEQGAGDQGLMFGFAINETPDLMPMPIDLSHKLVHYLADLRHNGTMKDILPDSKSQVTVEYRDGKPHRVDTVVISTQHREHVQHKDLEEMLIEQVIKKVIPAQFLQNTRYLINPTGRFVVGGPHGDCGLTGRKIIVDTYGGYGRHGGGAFSGKDPSKVDRSAAYMGRHIAKNIVASGLAEKCEVQLSYAIGFPEPTSVLVDTFGTGKISEAEISKRVLANFKLTPAGIEAMLKLREPGRTYLDTASYGHFGRHGETFTWEKTDLAAALKA